MMKICSKCGRELPLSEFYKCKSNKDGYKSYCKECDKEKRKKYYQVNRDKELERQKQYNETHKKEKKEYDRQHHMLYKKEFAKYHKQYYATQIGKAKRLEHAYKQEDNKMNRKNNITAQYILENIYNSVCIYCDESDWNKLGCDRIDNSIGHVIGNVVCCCTKCNKERGRKSFAEFYAMKKGITCELLTKCSPWC